MLNSVKCGTVYTCTSCGTLCKIFMLYLLIRINLCLPSILKALFGFSVHLLGKGYLGVSCALCSTLCFLVFNTHYDSYDIFKAFLPSALSVPGAQ